MPRERRPHSTSLLLSPEVCAGIRQCTAAYRKISVDGARWADLLQIGWGIYAPLQGLMGLDDYRSVAQSMHLSDGTLWPVPVALPVPQAWARDLRRDEPVLLTDGEGDPCAMLTVADCFSPEALWEGMASDGEHFRSGAVRYLGGPVRIFSDFTGDSEMPSTPQAIRRECQARGWRTLAGVTGLAGRSEMSREALYRVLRQVDGLLVLIPPASPASVELQQILEAVPDERILWAIDWGANQYRGLRAAIREAIVFKNLGCTHIIRNQSDLQTRENVESPTSDQDHPASTGGLAIAGSGHGVLSPCGMDGSTAKPFLPHKPATARPFCLPHGRPLGRPGLKAGKEPKGGGTP